MKRKSVTLLFILLVVSLLVAISGQNATAAYANSNDRLGTKPFMGWSTWNFIGTHPSEANIEAQASAEASALKKYGFNYVLLDDFWYLNPATTVDQFGRWVIDTAEFPHGLAGVASYVHGLGLKFGAYLTPGIPVAAVNQNTPIEGTPYHARDIADTSRHELNYNFGHGSKVTVMYYIDYSKPGAQAYVDSWAKQLASWGVDFLKIDGVGDWDIPDIQAWSHALQFSGRSIYFDLSNNLDAKNGTTWHQNANAWRIEGDVECYKKCPGHLVDWSHIAKRFTDAPKWTAFAGRGGSNDLDALDAADGSLDGITDVERQTYMTLWAISAAPLYMGDDLTQMDSYGLQLLSNEEVIDVDQSGRAASPISQASKQQVWSVRNRDNSYTVALFNLSNASATVTVNWSDLGLGNPMQVRDLWSHNNLGTFNGSFSALLPAHGSQLLRIKS